MLSLLAVAAALVGVVHSDGICGPDSVSTDQLVTTLDIGDYQLDVEQIGGRPSLRLTDSGNRECCATFLRTQWVYQPDDETFVYVGEGDAGAEIDASDADCWDYDLDLATGDLTISTRHNDFPPRAVFRWNLTFTITLLGGDLTDLTNFDPATADITINTGVQAYEQVIEQPRDFAVVWETGECSSPGFSSTRRLGGSGGGGGGGGSCRCYGDCDCICACDRRRLGGSGGGHSGCTCDTTMAPTSDPTTSPVTASPVTASPVTPSPVTPSPITSSPITPAPVTAGPTDTPTQSPTTESPATAAPVTPAPVTAAPVTAAPVTSAPVTPAPVTASPVTPAPVTAAPTTASPVTAAPVTATPTSNPSASPTTSEPTAVPTSTPTESPSESCVFLCFEDEFGPECLTDADQVCDGNVDCVWGDGADESPLLCDCPFESLTAVPEQDGVSVYVLDAGLTFPETHMVFSTLWPYNTRMVGGKLTVDQAETTSTVRESPATAHQTAAGVLSAAVPLTLLLA